MRWMLVAMLAFGVCGATVADAAPEARGSRPRATRTADAPKRTRTADVRSVVAKATEPAPSPSRAVVPLGGGAVASAGPAQRTPADGPVAYYVIDLDTGTVLAEKEAHKIWPPASMAKMMTVLVAMERVRDGTLRLDDPVHASAWASKIGGSQVYLAAGETFTLGQLLEAVMIASANDGAVAIAEHVAGSPQGFVDLMNGRAQALGMKETTFRSVHGLPPGAGQEADLTSAHDLAVLGRELSRFPEVMQWAGTPHAAFRNGTLQMMNTNHLVRGVFPGATGLKTGYTVASGFGVTATASRNDLNLLAVVLGLPTKKACFEQAARLMNEAFATWRVVVAAKRGAVVGEIPVAGGTGERIRAVATGDLRRLVKRSEDRGVAAEARIPRLLQAPVRKRQEVGTVVLRQGEQELGTVPVIADREVPAAGWLSWLWNRGLTGTN